jgi:hypothetical protein
VKRTDFYYFLTLGLILLFLFGDSIKLPHLHKPMRPVIAMPKEQLSSHAVTLQDEDDEPYGECTGTAIGPHALLLAEHCLHRGKAHSVTLDYSTEDHEILAAAGDGRDHAILLLDGTPFKNIVDVKQVQAKENEALIYFGAGGEQYPPVPKVGRSVNCEDPSDVDVSSGVLCTNLPAIQGDSGSAIFNLKGEIVGLITYTVSEAPYTNVDFALNFEQKQLDVAATFSGKEEDLPSAPKDLEAILDSIFGAAPKTK